MIETEWKRCGCMSVVEFGKLKQDNRDNEYRTKYEGQFVEVGWIGFFYKAVADPQLFVTLYGIGEGELGQGDRAAVAKVDKMIPCLFVYKRPRKQ